MEIKKLIILFSVILSFLKSKFEKTNKKYLNNIKKSIGKKKIFLIHLSSIGSSIYTSCYLKRLIIEKKISSQNLVIISDGNYINSFWKKKLINNFEIKDRPCLYRYLIKNSNLLKDIIIPWPFDGTNFENESCFNFLFSIEEENEGKEILRKLNINTNKKIVTISYKSNEYWLKRTSKDKKFETYRLSSPKNLIKSINYLANNNYQIVFTGQPSVNDKKILSKCIFYDELPIEKKQFFDFYIYSLAEFCVIGHSGDLAFAYLFNKTILHHNAIHPNFFCKGILLPKSFIDKKKQTKIHLLKLLKIKKIHFYSDIIFPYIKKISAIHFKNTLYFHLKNIEIIENTEDEILNSIKELINYIEKGNNMFLSSDTLKLQNNIRDEIFDSTVCKNHSLIELKKFRGFISPNYLNKTN